MRARRCLFSCSWNATSKSRRWPSSSLAAAVVRLRRPPSAATTPRLAAGRRATAARTPPRSAPACTSGSSRTRRRAPSRRISGRSAAARGGEDHTPRRASAARRACHPSHGTQLWSGRLANSPFRPRAPFRRGEAPSPARAARPGVLPRSAHPHTFSYTHAFGGSPQQRSGPRRAPLRAFALAPAHLTSPSAEKNTSTMASRPVVSVFTAEGEEESVASTTKMPGLPRADPHGHRAPLLHQHREEQAPAVLRQQVRGQDAVGGVVGHGRARCLAHPARAGRRHPPLGQGAFGNMCRGGRMFAPTKTWRKWHRKVNVTQKRHAIAAGLAASAGMCPRIVMARGGARSTASPRCRSSSRRGSRRSRRRATR